MYALIENNEIKETFSNIRALKIGDVQYPKNIFTVWSKEKKEAIGIYEIVRDNSNKKDDSLYTNTEVSYAFADGKVTASYGTATPKELGAVKSLKKTLQGVQVSMHQHEVYQIRQNHELNLDLIFLIEFV